MPKDKSDIAQFGYVCPIACGKEKGDVAKICRKACHYLDAAMADPANKDYYDFLKRIMDRCGGYPGKECGEALTIYRRMQELIVRDEKLKAKKA